MRNPLPSTVRLPTRTAETYTAHCTVISAVQFNKVYLTPFSDGELSEHCSGVR